MPRPRKPARLWLNRTSFRQPTWVILDGGRQHSTGCGAGDRGGAEKALAAYLNAQYQPPVRESRLDRLWLSDVMKVYLDEHAPTTMSLDWLAAMSGPIIEWWGTKPLSEVRAATCHEYVAFRCAQGVSDQTARHELKTMRAAINYWHANHGPLTAVPVVTLPAKADTRRDALTREEYDRLLAAVDEQHIARMIQICRWQGCRPGVAWAAMWLPSVSAPYFDLTARRFYQRGASERTSRKRKPVQVIHEALLPLLHEWRAADPEGIVHVCHYQGKAIAKSRRGFPGAVARAGLPSWVTPHCLRHTAITWAVESGLSFEKCCEFYGMSPETLRQTYWHASPEFQSDAARM